VETIAFDSFRTIVSVETPTRRAFTVHVDDPVPVADRWRFRAVDDRTASTFTDAYDLPVRSADHRDTVTTDPITSHPVPPPARRPVGSPALVFGPITRRWRCVA